MTIHPSKMEGFFIAAVLSFLLKPFTVKHPAFSSQTGSKLGIAWSTKNKEMKSLQSFIKTNIRPWHLLAGIYGFIIVAGIIYRILNA